MPSIAINVPIMQIPDYTLATADILTAATLAKLEAKKAAVKAVLEAYFPATGPIDPSGASGFHLLKLLPDGRVEEWEGSTYRGVFINIQDVCAELARRSIKP